MDQPTSPAIFVAAITCVSAVRFAPALLTNSYGLSIGAQHAAVKDSPYDLLSVHGFRMTVFGSCSDAAHFSIRTTFVRFGSSVNNTKHRLSSMFSDLSVSSFDSSQKLAYELDPEFIMSSRDG